MGVGARAAAAAAARGASRSISDGIRSEGGGSSLEAAGSRGSLDAIQVTEQGLGRYPRCMAIGRCRLWIPPHDCAFQHLRTVRDGSPLSLTQAFEREARQGAQRLGLAALRVSSMIQVGCGSSYRCELKGGPWKQRNQRNLL